MHEHTPTNKLTFSTTLQHTHHRHQRRHLQQQQDNTTRQFFAAFCCRAAPSHSYDHDMHFPWPYAHTTPPPLPATQPQPTWPMPQPSTAPTFPSTQPSAYPHPQPQPFQPQPVLSAPTATALTYGIPSTWTFVPPCHVPPQPTHPAPVFPTAAPPPSYLLPPPHPTTPAELPPPTTLTHPPPTQQQTAIANYPSTDPQCAIPQGVWQPYSAFPPSHSLHSNRGPRHRLHKLPMPQRQPNLHFNSSYHRIQHHRSNPSPRLPRTIHYQSKTHLHQPPYPNIQHPPRWYLPHQHLELHYQHQTNLTPLPHRHHNHLPPNHHTAAAATITRADASPTITTEDATATAADIAITAIPNTTAKPGDGGHLQHPPTHLASHHPAVGHHHNPLIYAQTPNTPTLTPLNIPPQPSFVAQSTVGDLHPTFTPSHLQTKSWNGSNSTPPNSPIPTDHNTSTLPISSQTATSPTRRSPISDNIPTLSGMTQLTNTTNSSTMPFHFPSSTPKPLHQSHLRFPAPHQPTGKSPTSTQATQAPSVTFPTFYAKAVFYPAHSTLPTTLDFLPRAFASPTTNSMTTTSLLASSTIPGNSTRIPIPL